MLGGSGSKGVDITISRVVGSCRIGLFGIGRGRRHRRRTWVLVHDSFVECVIGVGKAIKVSNEHLKTSSVCIESVRRQRESPPCSQWGY